MNARRLRVSLAVLCAMMVLLAPAAGKPAAASAPQIALVIDGRAVTTDVPPLLRDGRTLVPIRVISEYLGARVTWDPAARRVDVVAPGGRTVALRVGSKDAQVNGAPVTLDVPAQIVNGRTMVPLRFIGEALGAEVTWDEPGRVVRVESVRVTGINWAREASCFRITVHVTGPAKWSASASDAAESGLPYISLDLDGARLQYPDQVLPIQDGNVLQIRTGMMSLDPPLSRVVIDLNEPVRYRVVPVSGSNDLAVEVGYKVTRAALEARADGRALVIEATGPITPTVSLVSSPVRLVVDVPNSSLSPGVPAETVVKNEVVQRIRASQQSVAPDVVRVEADLRRPLGYEAFPTPNGVDIYFLSRVQDVAWEKSSSGVRVRIEADMPAGATTFILNDPLRLAVDIPHATLGIPPGEVVVDSGPLQKITWAQFSAEPAVVRVVLQLTAYSGHEIAITGRGLDVNLFRSAPSGKRIVLDPGHGGTDPGAIGPSGTYEKNINIAIARELVAILRAGGAQVTLTRSADETVDLYTRPQIADAAAADVFLSIHCNSFKVQAKVGVEVYWYENNPQSAELARLVHEEMLTVGVPDRGLRSEDFAVLREGHAPAALVEVAFLSNPGEERLLLDPAFRKRVAEALARALERFLGSLRG